MFYHCQKCNEIIGDTALARTFISDPLGTGDSPDEVEMFCPVCGSGEVVECVPCDCLQNPTLDGFDDCAHCILSGTYCHNTEYDAGDFEDARRWLAVNAPADLCSIEENYAENIDLGREIYAEISQARRK